MIVMTIDAIIGVFMSILVVYLMFDRLMRVIRDEEVDMTDFIEGISIATLLTAILWYILWYRAHDIGYV